MTRFLTALFLLGAATPALAQHQHHSAAPAGAAAGSVLPEACRSGASAPASGHADMATGNLNAHQRESMAAMIQMDRDMMEGMMQEDADMAFMCGMIAHHQGAIAMAEVELEHGDDAEAKALARRIIDAQRSEIAEMTAWVEKRPR